MNRIIIMAAGVSAAALGASVYAATPAAPPPPIASYWMDVATASGLGAGMTPGGRPSMNQMMGMMTGSAPSVMHTIDLKLASRTKPAAAPEANHLIPPGLQMGPRLPLITPAAPKPVKETNGLPPGYEKPKGRMLIYWGCGEHAGAGQPTVIDFSKLAAGQVPPGMAAMANFARTAKVPHTAPGFGEWPNNKDHRPVPASGSLIGQHKVEAIGRQFDQHIRHTDFPAGHLDWLGQVEDGFDEVIRHQFRKRVRHPEIEAQWSRSRPLLHRVHEILADGKNLFGIAEHLLPGIREHQSTSSAAEQSLAERIFQRANLRADCRL